MSSPRRVADAATPPQILAAVVTYNPDGDLKRNLSALRAQVDAVTVIDNGSANLRDVERAALETGCELVRNGANLGIAAALSQAARLAQARGYAWLATFDQDSLLMPDAIAALLNVLDGHPERDRIAVMAMTRRDRGTGRDYHFRWDILNQTPVWQSVRTTITSGSLVRVAAFDDVGLFDDALFIDSVDHEFCLRCRSHGWLVIEARARLMDHSIGASTEHSFLGYPITCMNQSPTRRYYITRNQLEVCRRYALKDFVWSLTGLYVLAGGSVLTVIYEPDRWAKFTAMLAGARDFALRRFGPRAGRPALAASAAMA